MDLLMEKVIFRTSKKHILDNGGVILDMESVNNNLKTKKESILALS